MQLFVSILFLTFLCPVIFAGLSPAEKRRAEQYTSVFENDTPNLQYAYCENIKDGRGFTAGRAGFTTATCDAKVVIEKYTAKKKNNQLAKYLPELKHLCSKESKSTDKLKGYCDAWKQEAKDKLFRDTQDQVVDDMYYKPAMKHAAGVGLKKALSKAALYDTIIQHGEGNDPDSIGALIKRTNQKSGGKVKDGVDEKKWLSTFFQVRRENLKNPHNKESQKEWAKSVDRVDAMVKLLKEGNMDFKPPIKIDTPNHKATIN